MIPQANITAWRASAPGRGPAQLEHRRAMSRAVVELFGAPGLADAIALRGGTSLNKLFIDPPARYSEDIDLVQTKPGNIGPILDAIAQPDAAASDD
jgi:predicted nucleotidyltransferase component of viral defense system